MRNKLVYLVLAYTLDPEAPPVICAVCDSKYLASSFCDDVRVMSDSYYKVDIVEYTLNCLEAW